MDDKLVGAGIVVVTLLLRETAGLGVYRIQKQIDRDLEKDQFKEELE